MPLDLKCWEYRYVQPHSHYMSTSWGVGKGGVTTRTLGDNLTVSSFSPDRLQSWDLSCQVWSQTPLPTEPFLQYILSSLKTGFHFGMPHFICSTINRYRWFKILAELLDDMINLFKLFFWASSILLSTASTTSCFLSVLHILINIAEHLPLAGVYILLGGMWRAVLGTEFRALGIPSSWSTIELSPRPSWSIVVFEVSGVC